jgi:hypothetical protein
MCPRWYLENAIRSWILDFMVAQVKLDNGKLAVTLKVVRQNSRRAPVFRGLDAFLIRE